MLCVTSKFVCNITTNWFIGLGKNDELLSWNLRTTSARDRKNVVLDTITI